MDLQEELIRLKEELNAKLPSEVNSANRQMVEELRIKSSLSRKPRVGDRLDLFEKNFNFSLPDSKGKMVELAGLLDKGPVVLSFYRGSWCPYCNLEMKVLRSTSDAIRKLGGQFVAISPDLLHEAPSGMITEEPDFHILSDSTNTTAKKLGLSFEVPAYLFEAYKGVGINLEEFQGKEKAVLPIPATFVIDTSGMFVFTFASEDFTKRASVSGILSALDKIRQAKGNY